MFNPFLMLYVLVLLFFIGGVLVVSYHLWTYRLNSSIAGLVIIIFTLGAIFALLGSLVIAGSINWSQGTLIF